MGSTIQDELLKTFVSVSNSQASHLADVATSLTDIVTQFGEIQKSSPSPATRTTNPIEAATSDWGSILQNIGALPAAQTTKAAAAATNDQGGITAGAVASNTAKPQFPGPGVPPFLIFSDPVNGATGVSVNTSAFSGLHEVELGVQVFQSFGNQADGWTYFDNITPEPATLTLFGRVVELRYRVRRGNVAPSAIVVNGVPLPLTRREGNPYRPGGWRVSVGDLMPLLGAARDVVEVSL
jgi:hypothetical protein